MEGHSSILQQLLNSGADIDEMDDDGWTALYRAARNGHMDSVETLLDSHACVSQTTSTGLTVLHAAVYNRHTKIEWKVLTAFNAELSENPPIGTVSTSSNADEWNVADHLKLCLELVRKYPEDISLHQYLADAYVQSRRFPEANLSAENALDLDPKNAEGTNLS